MDFRFSVQRQVDEWTEYLILKPKKGIVVAVVVANKWEAPSADFIKLILDVAFREESRSGG